MYRKLLLALLLGGAGVQADTLAPFTSDGCSLFPDGTPRQQNLWLDCCIEHDLAYWQGGDQAARRAADRALAQCVDNLGENTIAELMHTGVRAGGSPWFPTPYRWGYGWPYLRGYKPLAAAEREQVRLRLTELEQRLARLRLLVQEHAAP